jgi:translocation and assembly module TamB
MQGYYPGLISYGSVSVAMKISGTWQQPTMGGQVEISNAGLSLIDLPNGLSEIKGTLVFNQNRLYIRSLTARTGGGDLKLGGFIAYSQGIYFDLAATGSDVRLRYPPGISAEASADLRFVGSPSNSTLSGEITVNRFALTPSFDFGSYLASKQSTLVSNADAPLSNIHFAVHIVTRPELQVQSSLARVSGDADLNLRGTLARPVLLGRINISSGDVFFNGTKYHLERGDMLFVNPLAIEPIIDVAATTRVRDYDITLGFHGPLNHLAATYRSDPPLPTADVITLLALGRTRDEQVLNNNPQSSTTITESAANAVLGQALNYAVSSRVQRLFGASRIKIDPRVGEPGTPNARLTVEQAVSNQVTVTYITNLSQSAQQVVQVEVQLNPNLSLVGVRDQYGVLGFDFRIRQRKR